ncbi:YggT family protein [Candidatus Peregrinibacteria bacterium]|nr:YggT family protein [Candidatus Peregrinibacteria bacterium]
MQFFLIFILNVIKILKYAILVRVLMSWIRSSASPGRFTRFIYEATDPFLRVIRSLLPNTGMIDFSPLIAFFLLDLAEIGIAWLLT